MNQIQHISDSALQKQTIILGDGTTFTMVMYFRPLQKGWFFNEITYGTFSLKGLRICNSPNILYQFQNQLPFGIGCYSAGNREPSLQQDFSSGASKLFVLTEAEVASYTELIRFG